LQLHNQTAAAFIPATTAQEVQAAVTPDALSVFVHGQQHSMHRGQLDAMPKLFASSKAALLVMRSASPAQQQQADTTISLHPT
jgi:hypothetical protein